MKNTFLIIAIAAFATMAFTPGTTDGTTTSARPASSGIKFEHMTLEKALDKAKSSGKLIFVDVHTTWCGPCKEMARTTFQSDKVGKVFNKKFINLKIDAENDVDGASVSRSYSVNAYPTLLFINAEGKLVKKLVGKQSEEKLLAVANGL
jgi:thioredoxin 1